MKLHLERAEAYALLKGEASSIDEAKQKIKDGLYPGLSKAKQRNNYNNLKSGRTQARSGQIEIILSICQCSYECLTNENFTI
jgi:hypothetical protein